MKRPRNELLREALEMITARGYAPVVRNGGKHLKVSWSANGRRHTVTISSTPSARCARIQSRAILRRLLCAGTAAQSLRPPPRIER
jgi:hypothetical protein